MYKIGANNASYRDQAIKEYLRSVSRFNQNTTQKALMLRKLMTIAQTTTQKESILKELVRNRTFNALIFADNYLDDPQLQQTAASIVLNKPL
ncbi:MAG: hypothetical protein R2822_26300 [Spirosomataceae bacterium]